MVKSFLVVLSVKKTSSAIITSDLFLFTVSNKLLYQNRAKFNVLCKQGGGENYLKVRLSPSCRNVALSKWSGSFGLQTRDVCPSQVLLPPYEEAIAIPPKEPPPQYMEAWEASLQDPNPPQPAPAISLLSLPEQEHDSGCSPSPNTPSWLTLHFSMSTSTASNC